MLPNQIKECSANDIIDLDINKISYEIFILIEDKIYKGSTDLASLFYYRISVKIGY